MHELLKSNGLRLVIEPDIYGASEGLGSFLLKNNLSIVVRTESPSPFSEPQFVAELSKRHFFIHDEEGGTKIKNGVQTNTQYYFTPDITAFPFENASSYNGERKVGIGKDIKTAIANLFSETKEMHLIIESSSSAWDFVKIPNFNFFKY